MAEQGDPGGLRRRADKLRFIGWANLLVSVAAGLFLDFGDTATRWTAAVVWALLFLGACYVRAAHMDKSGPVQRRAR